jgi:hypothetical protein
VDKSLHTDLLVEWFARFYRWALSKLRPTVSTESLEMQTYKRTSAFAKLAGYRYKSSFKVFALPVPQDLSNAARLVWAHGGKAAGNKRKTVFLDT